jgi:hypothetical protein
MDPKIPTIFAQWLALLSATDAEAMYQMAVEAAPSNYVTLAIQDITQPQGNDDYGGVPE